LVNVFEESKVRGRHSAIDEDSEREILELNEAQIDKCKQIIRTEILHYRETKYFRPVSRGWVDSFILRHRNDMTETKSTPQEDRRLEVPRAFLDEQYAVCESMSKE
jgi:hypothetical protein